jgi:hypothetical protein
MPIQFQLFLKINMFKPCASGPQMPRVQILSQEPGINVHKSYLSNTIMIKCAVCNVALQLSSLVCWCRFTATFSATDGILLSTEHSNDNSITKTNFSNLPMDYSLLFSYWGILIDESRSPGRWHSPGFKQFLEGQHPLPSVSTSFLVLLVCAHRNLAACLSS